MGMGRITGAVWFSALGLVGRVAAVAEGGALALFESPPAARCRKQPVGGIHSYELIYCFSGAKWLQNAGK